MLHSGTIKVHTPMTVPKKSPTCTSAGYEAYSLCQDCGIQNPLTPFTIIPALGHDYGEWFVAQPASCTQGGTEQRACKRSGCSARETRAIAATGHTWDSGEVIRKAGCIYDGEIKYTCTECGETKTEDIPALGHGWGETKPGQEPTCTSAGYTSYKTCLRCSYTTRETIPALGHSYGSYTQTKAPTCTEDGTETATCIRCTSQETRTIDALGHNTVTNLAVPATCTEDGKTEGSHCSVCGEVFEAQEIVPKLGHDYGAYSQTKAPTCTTLGEEKATCSRCGAETTRTVAALGHSSVTDPAVSATCTETGLTDGAHCSRCDTVIKAQQEVPALGHDWGAYSQTTAPTCTEKGVETSECSRCGEMQTRDIEALGHIEVKDAAVAATCTSSGKTEGIHCSRCNAVIKVQQEVPTLGHDWSEYVQTKAPTCTEEGVKTSTCSRCDEERTQSIAAKGHTLGPDATCTEDQVCTVCGAVISAAEGHIPGPAATCTTPQTCTVCGTELKASLGHDLQHHEAQAATCTEIGWNAYDTCSRCDYSTYVEIAAKGHTAGPAATCLTSQTCTVCGTELKSALGHDLQHHEAQAATCTEIGWDAYDTCSRCDYTTYAEIVAKGHVLGAEPTCVTPQTCTVCGAELKAATGHTKGPDPTCTEAQVCTVCGVELAPELGHVNVSDEAVPATCTETGLTEGAHCSRCEEVLLEQDVVLALGHFLLAVEDSRESCTDAGTLTRRCDRCDYIEVKEVSGGTHSWRPGDILREPTCAEVGIQELRCVFCDATKTSEIARLQHKVVEVPVVAPTCTEPGATYGLQCSVCGTVLLARDYIPALQHDMTYVAGQAPTETEDGYAAHYVCSHCGGLFADEDGEQAVTDDDLRIPAGSSDIDDGEDPLPDADDEDKGMTPLQIAMAVVALVVLLAVIFAVVSALSGKRKRRKIK